MSTYTSDAAKAAALIAGLQDSVTRGSNRKRPRARMPSADLSQTRCAASRTGSPDWSVGNLPALAALDRGSLRRLWHELFGGVAPPKAAHALLVYCLAYRIQENAYGGLSAASRTRLRNIAQKLISHSAASRPIAARIAPGTRLIRQWREQRHEVTVLENGYAYRGSRYTSLSAIARLISGTHCSGPRFFGLTFNSTMNSAAADGP